MTNKTLYVSTRGEAPEAAFDEVLLAGLAPDGGLFVPAVWPRLNQGDLANLSGRSFADVAETVTAPFVGDAFDRGTLRKLIETQVAAFRHACVAPLSQIGPNDWVMELFHGPTLAFKDVAMQLLGPLFEAALKKRTGRLTIVGATSGDTGSAAIEAMRGREGTDIFVLFPDGRVSDVQRRQMTTVADANVHCLAVEGTFDDCQRIVKDLFADGAFRDEVKLSGVNSINWARIMAQTVYYVTAGLALGAPERPVSFVVPTGNFGDIFAGLVAKRMGLPVGRLIIATNTNDILVRCLASGRYEVGPVTQTTSPSMDIQVSSNFERLLFEASGRNAAAVRALMGGLKQSGAFDVGAETLAAIRTDFAAHKAGEGDVAQMIARHYAATARLADPHTAVGLVALEKARRAGDIAPHEPAVVLATAHPAKFADPVEKATGVRPDLPPHLGDLMEREERQVRVRADTAMIKEFIRSHTALMGRSHRS